MKHQFSQSARLRHTLQLQALGIETVLHAFGIHVRVVQGASAPGLTRFDLVGAGQVRTRRLTVACQSVRDLLAVERVALARQGVGWRLDVVPRQAKGKALLDLLPELPSARPGLALLGLSDSKRPVFLDLDRRDSQHVLIHGGAGCGKTSLLRAMVLGLALTHRQADMQVVVLTARTGADPDGAGPWHGFNFVPHIVGAVRQGPQAGGEALCWLRARAEIRQRERLHRPRIVLVCDDLPELLSSMSTQAAGHLAYLLHRGTHTGMHVLAAARDEQLPALPASLQLGFRLLLSERGVPASRDPAGHGQATGGSNGLVGAFVAISGPAQLALQAPYVSDYDLHYAIQQLLRRKQPALYARPLSRYGVLMGSTSRVWDQVSQIGKVKEYVPDPLGI